MAAASRFQPLRTSARASLWAAAAAGILVFLTVLTLDEGVASAALVALGAFIACALYAILGMSRYTVASVAAGATAVTIGSALAFLRLIGIAWDQDPEMVSTVSTRDADPYFFVAALAAATALAVLFVGAAWPEARRTALVTRARGSVRRPPAAGRTRAGARTAAAARTAGAGRAPSSAGRAGTRSSAPAGSRPAAGGRVSAPRAAQRSA